MHRYLEGESGHYFITERGEQRGEVHVFNNGYGSFVYRQWDYVSGTRTSRMNCEMDKRIIFAVPLGTAPLQIFIRSTWVSCS